MLASISAAGIVWAGGWAQAGARGGRVRRLATAALLAAALLANVGLYLPLRLGGLRGLFGISRSAIVAFQEVDPGAAVVIVHRNPYWHGYGNLLTPPFLESDLKLIYERGPEIDARAAALFPDLPVYHYYPDEPGQLPSSSRG